MESDIKKEEAIAVSLFSKTTLSITLKFKDVVYEIRRPTGFQHNACNPACMAGGVEDKLILKGATGSVYPGEMLAMLGPSGSGKTTLLTSLGGRLSHSRGRLGGTIHYNGRPLNNAINRAIGFVTQDDVLYPHLTVAETLSYTAQLRLPKAIPRPEKDAYAASVIQMLGLERCKDSLVGGQLVRGVSGGERKRVSIGQELLINPGLIFLDEPTSGLDSTTAQTIVSTLARMAAGGRTVVMTIHQPSSRLFYMFDKVMLLSEGDTIYFGKGCEAMDYFFSLGYAPLIAMNPSDFLLDLANGVSPNGSDAEKSKVKMSLVQGYRVHQYDKLKEEASDEDDRSAAIVGKGKWCTSWFQQFEVLLRRGVKERKHETFSKLRIIEVLLVAMFCTILWWGTKPDQIQSQSGLLFFYASFWSFYPVLGAVFTFPPERLMLTKERSSGMYRLSAYFLARTAGDMPMDLVLPTIYVTASYWTSGLDSHPGAYFLTLFIILFSVVTAQGLGLAIGACVKDIKAASCLASVLLLTFLLVSGFYGQEVPAFIAWIKYLSFDYYTYKLLLAAQYTANQTYKCGTAVCFVKDYPTIKVAGIGDMTMSFLALLLMIIGYRVLTYFALMRIGAKRS